MHPRATVDPALSLHLAGAPPSEIARQLGVPVETVRHWCRGDRRARHDEGNRPRRCPSCHGAELDEAAYAYLLGQYLGDGHITVGRRGVASLSVFCSDDWPGVRGEVDEALGAVMPTSSTCHVARRGCCEVKSYSMHWTCLFPQHGPGRKHTRSIVLEPWQDDIARDRPGLLLRGLFHSDGCRSINWARPRAGGKRYEYIRYLFSNKSDDILDICAHALDAVGAEHRRPRRDMISVATRASVVLLDELVGPKS